MKPFIKHCIILLILTGLMACQPEKSSQPKIGIIVPLEHTAMKEIVAGFSETLTNLYHQPVYIKVANAQSDNNLQRAIIQQMRDENYTMIVPIGTGATEMSLAIVHNQPIVSLAAKLSEHDREQRNPCNVALVRDEISSKKIIEFIHAVYPTIKNIALIHSAADKVFPEVNETISIGKQYGITITHIMAATLPELTSSVQSLPRETQAIFILKDSLIVSGISTLAKAASERHIPLITSDQGSVQDGAGFALGVHEKEIGVAGAKLASEILLGKPACALPIAEMKTLTVFINKKALFGETQNEKLISDAAAKFGYKIEFTDSTKKV
jgi:putative ABC transport system substrate-binding protein